MVVSERVPWLLGEELQLPWLLWSAHLHTSLFKTLCVYYGAFTLGVRDSSVESLNTILVVIQDLNLLIVKILG
jgi:hypothetical protein